MIGFKSALEVACEPVGSPNSRVKMARVVITLGGLPVHESHAFEYSGSLQQARQDYMIAFFKTCLTDTNTCMCPDLPKS